MSANLCHQLCPVESGSTAAYAAPAAPRCDAPPTFLVGSVRSGTTLLRLMLDHHPRLAFHFEFEFAVDRLGPQGEFPPLDQYRAYLRQDRVFRLSGATIDPQLDYLGLVSSFLEQHRRRANKPSVGATVHHRFDLLPKLWPQARYVHLLRDGRDVASSCIAMGWAGNMYCASDRWLRAERCWDRLRGQLSRDQWIEVRYESLIRQPEVALHEICDFLGEKLHQSMFDYAHSSDYGLPDARFTSQWKSRLSDREIQLAEHRQRELLVARGYELSGLPAIDVDAALERRLRHADWLARAAYRRRRYGLPLLAADFLGRRLRLRPLARWTKRRTDAIDNQHIR